MKKINILLILLLIFNISYSREIKFEFSFHADKPVYLTFKQGTAVDTVYTGKLDAKGLAIVPLADAWKTYEGLATVLVDQTSFDFIVSENESPVIRCSEEYFHGGNTVFENSPENEHLQKWFLSQTARFRKLGRLTELEGLYDKNDMFYPPLQKERQKLENEQNEFKKELESSPLYAARLIRYHNYAMGEIAGLVLHDSLQMQKVRTYVRDSLDINGLFNSGLWFNTLNGLLALYENGTPYHREFITDMSLLLERAKSEEIYSALSENLFSICERMGWNDLEEQLAFYLINSGRIRNPIGKLQSLMTILKLGKGSQAPILTQAGAKPFSGKTLLVFYESGCGSCENELYFLKANYSLIKEKGYEVISVSSDMDAQVFKNTSNDFPWKDKLCDLKGFAGKDLQNYGVVGTPTFYLIDETGVIQGRYARLKDTGLVIGN